MSKKDLLERLTRAPSEAPLRIRRDEPEPPGGRPPTDSVTTRMNARVVRRRHADGADPSVPPVARRRAAILTEEAPPAAPSAPARRAETPHRRGVDIAPEREHVEPATAPVPTEPVDAAHAPSHKIAVEPAPVEPPRKAKRARPTAPPVDSAAPDGRRAGAAPEPEVAAPAVEPPSAPAPIEERVGEELAAAGADEQPRYAGLGKAVVTPPPGYDPTNPLAFRRMQEAERSVSPADRRANRRRVETPAEDRTYQDLRSPGAAPARRRRGSPAAPAGRMMERPVRAKRRSKGGPKQSSPAPKAQKRKIKVDNVISVGQLAHELGIKAPVVIRQLMDLGVMAQITQMLDTDTAALVASEFEYEVENVGFQEKHYLETEQAVAGEEGLTRRPPVVTIMGHVDHGKTTLLDAIRKARVAAGEAGGITQHIGAYQVETKDGTITFIDTPGHEAFTAMRARGAEVTDLVVLVVAADDGVQPQTLEALAHAQAAEVPIVVAVNKMDKPGAAAEPIMTRLSENGLSPEQWGGDTMFVPVSALRGEGLDDLLESILLQAEVLDLKANPELFAEGIVLEAKMERGRGAVATVLVQSGTLNRGDHVVLGSAYGKVRAILSHTGETLKDAGPSTPDELFGLSELPEVGDAVNAVKSEKNARALAEHRAAIRRAESITTVGPRTAEELYAHAQIEDREIFHIVLKADVGGSLQAIKSAIEKIQVPGAEARILLAGVGDVTESDVNLAVMNGARIIGFNVRVDPKARQAASMQGLEPEFYTVIYEVLDRVEKGLKGKLAPVYEQVRQGTVEVRQLFKISKVGTVAGSFVTEGKVARSHTVKVMREGGQVWEGKVLGVKRFKEDVREVTAGFECGVSLDGFDELKEGDILETYAEQLVGTA